jgi:anti-anti-sigma factor
MSPQIESFHLKSYSGLSRSQVVGDYIAHRRFRSVGERVVVAVQLLLRLKTTMVPLKSESLKIETLDGTHGARIIKLSGPLTLQTLFDFQQTARQEVTQPIVIDLTNVSYMDSGGLGSVLGVLASCQRTQRGFALVGLTERIRTLIEVSRVDGLLPCYDSLDAAESAVMRSGAS